MVVDLSAIHGKICAPTDACAHDAWQSCDGAGRYRSPLFKFLGDLIIDTDDRAAAGLDTDTSILEDVKGCLAQSLQLGDKAEGLTADSRLLGELPELDSMAVITVVTSLEEYFGITVDDDDLSAETFETVGGLVELVREKLR